MRNRQRSEPTKFIKNNIYVFLTHTKVIKVVVFTCTCLKCSVYRNDFTGLSDLSFLCDDFVRLSIRRYSSIGGLCVVQKRIYSFIKLLTFYTGFYRK